MTTSSKTNMKPLKKERREKVKYKAVSGYNSYTESRTGFPLPKTKMTTLNTDAKRKVFEKIIYTEPRLRDVYGELVKDTLYEEVWDFISSSLQEAYQKGKDDQWRIDLELHKTSEELKGGASDSNKNTKWKE